MKDLRNKREQLMAQLDEMVATVETEVRIEQLKREIMNLSDEEEKERICHSAERKAEG